MFTESIVNRNNPSILQGDQLNMAVFFWYIEKNDLYATVHVYTGQVTFYKLPEKHGHV